MVHNFYIIYFDNRRNKTVREKTYMYMMENIKRIRNFLHDSILVSPDTARYHGGRLPLVLLHFLDLFWGEWARRLETSTLIHKLPVNSTTFTTVLLLSSVFGGPLVLNCLILPIANNISLVFRRRKGTLPEAWTGQGFGALFLSRLSTNPAGFCYCCFYLFGWIGS